MFVSDKIKDSLYTIDELFATPEKWARFHDVLVECGFGSVTMEQAKQVFFELPEGVKYIAFKWGMGDTVFGDEAFTHLQTLENK